MPFFSVTNTGRDYRRWPFKDWEVPAMIELVLERENPEFVCCSFKT